jgi:alpha-galactosidase
MRLLTAELHCREPSLPGDRFFLNGYQSWTDSVEHGAQDRQDRIRLPGCLAAGIYRFKSYGDYSFVRPGRGKGRFHGFSYAYRRRQEGLDLIASLEEDSAFTLFRLDAPAGKLSAVRDCHGRELAAGERFCLFALGLYSGTEDECFNSWFADRAERSSLLPQRLLPQRLLPSRPARGWTSWYRFYQNINEAVILENLRAFAARIEPAGVDPLRVEPERKAPAQVTAEQDAGSDLIFQIDDGYQTAVGDWLSIDEGKFPRGLAPIAEEIHARGMRAGLWLAPFAAQANSRLAREHPQWLLPDGKGKPVLGGSNWGGFYALDPENPEVRNYVSQVLKKVLSDWGFDLVKLDFLYAACLQPKASKTRAELMSETIAFLRSAVDSNGADKRILACGVPLASAFGRVEYCRIGCDVSLQWEEPWYIRTIHRERESAARSIGNALGRRHLDGRAFLNDPDVFILREEGVGLNAAQREMLFFINTLLGSLVFTSDQVDQYSGRADELFAQCEPALRREFLHMEEVGRGRARIRYKEGGKEGVALIDLTEGWIKQE